MPLKNASYYFSPDVLELSDILLAIEDKERDYTFQDEFNELPTTTPIKNVPNQPKLSKSPPARADGKIPSPSQGRSTSTSPSPSPNPAWAVPSKSSTKAAATSPKKQASDVGTSPHRQSAEKNDAHASPAVSCLKKTITPGSAKSVKFAELADQFEVENFKKWNKKEGWLSRSDVARQVQNEALIARYEQLWADLHYVE